MRIYPRGKKGILWADFTVDGERVKRSTGTTSRAAAEEWAATLARDLWRTRRLGEAPTVTWDAAVLAWLGEHGHLRSIEDIKYRLNWFTPHLQGRPLTTLTAERVRELAALRKAEKVKGGGTTSNATVNRHLAEVSKILHYAHERSWLPAVPPIAKMHEPAKRVTWLTSEEARALLSELPPHLRAMAAFSLATGLRETNVRLLCWQQIDMKRRVAWIYADQAKAGKDLSVPLNEQAMLVLRSQEGQHARWVFPVPHWETPEGEEVAVQISNAPTGKISNHAWRKACVRAGLPKLRFHDLRHTWASWHVQAGTPLPVLQELGGWASLAMVQRYAHLGVSHVAAWASNIGGGTSSVHPRIGGTKANGPEGPFTEVNQVGWLTGLEPATTGITKRASSKPAKKINNLAQLKPGKSR